jgi:transglutaminase-like putative cysteine protease
VGSGTGPPLAETPASRRLLAALPAVALVTYAWTLLEVRVAPHAFAACAVLAAAAAVATASGQRAHLVAVPVAGVAALAVAYRTWPNDALGDAWEGLRDAPAVQAPFDPVAFPTLHGLVVVAAFALALLAGLGAAFGRPWALAGAVAAGVGFPAVLLEDAHALRLGLLALGSVLWGSLALGAADVRRGVAGAALGAGLVAVTAGVALAGLSPGAGRVDWRGWDPFASAGSGDVRFLWDASYSGIDFPLRPTVMLRVRAPARAEYWRISTLETFAGDRWIENLYPAGEGIARGRLPADPLVPRRDRRPGSWLEQKVTVVGLDDERVPAATEPALVDAPSLGRVSYLQGGVVRARRPLRRGEEYTVWSYAPRPTPRQLAASPARYPAAAARYLGLWTTQFPAFGVRGREARVEQVFRDTRYGPLQPYRPLWKEARKLTARARSPYEATLVLERWFRDRGGFRYEEHPPPTASGNPPLVDFVEVTRAGYCQHYAGAMALMLRMIGVPARVAVGFTAGTWKGGVWTVTDHQAHAWVEAWFAGYGWLAFDPTPGRGTLSAVYTLASDSADAVRALGTGRFLDFTPSPVTPGRRTTPAVVAPAESGSIPWWLVAALCAPPAAAVALVALKRARRARRLGRGDPRRLAAGVRAELVSALVDRGADVERNATPTELRRAAERVLRVPARSLADALAEARYGPATRAGAASERARGELLRILAAATARERPRDRLRAALSMRSLRPASAR